MVILIRQQDDNQMIARVEAQATVENEQRKKQYPNLRRIRQEKTVLMSMSRLNPMITRSQRLFMCYQGSAM